jgi:penicillin V acylase-like amidase (Ntn superfamily)
MKKIIPLLLLCLWGQYIAACTTFCINKNGQIIFGRNYDWITGEGIVNTNQRGLFKTSMKVGNNPTASWVSKYGSITFNQYGKEFPTGGMNEKGLVVELMWLDGTKYPATDERPAVGILQWIQYQLDNAATTAEVIASDGQLRISERATPIHFLVADAGGNVATIEFLDGKMVVHKDESLPFPVLTNDTYESSVRVAKPLVNQTNIDLQNNSLERFAKACSMVKKFNESGTSMPITDFAFSILDKVAQGSFTKWSIVYDITNRKIHFKTEANKEIKEIQFSLFDLACNQPAKMFNMNQSMNGDVSRRFILPDKKLKKEIMNRVVTESSSRVSITKEEEERLLTYEDGVSCKQN